MGTQTDGHQIVKCSKLKKLAILMPIRFDTPFDAAQETPKRVPKQTGTKTTGYQNKQVPTCLVFIKKNLPF